MPLFCPSYYYLPLPDFWTKGCLQEKTPLRLTDLTINPDIKQITRENFRVIGI